MFHAVTSRIDGSVRCLGEISPTTVVTLDTKEKKVGVHDTHNGKQLPWKILDNLNTNVVFCRVFKTGPGSSAIITVKRHKSCEWSISLVRRCSGHLSTYPVNLSPGFTQALIAFGTPDSGGTSKDLDGISIECAGMSCDHIALVVLPTERVNRPRFVMISNSCMHQWNCYPLPPQTTGIPREAAVNIAHQLDGNDAFYVGAAALLPSEPSVPFFSDDMTMSLRQFHRPGSPGNHPNTPSGAIQLRVWQTEIGSKGLSTTMTSAFSGAFMHRASFSTQLLQSPTGSMLILVGNHFISLNNLDSPTPDSHCASLPFTPTAGYSLGFTGNLLCVVSHDDGELAFVQPQGDLHRLRPSVRSKVACPRFEIVPSHVKGTGKIASICMSDGATSFRLSAVIPGVPFARNENQKGVAAWVSQTRRQRCSVANITGTAVGFQQALLSLQSDFEFFHALCLALDHWRSDRSDAALLRDLPLATSCFTKNASHNRNLRWYTLSQSCAAFSSEALHVGDSSSHHEKVETNTQPSIWELFRNLSLDKNVPTEKIISVAYAYLKSCNKMDNEVPISASSDSPLHAIGILLLCKTIGACCKLATDGHANPSAVIGSNTGLLENFVLTASIEFEVSERSDQQSVLKCANASLECLLRAQDSGRALLLASTVTKSLVALEKVSKKLTGPLIGHLCLAAEELEFWLPHLAQERATFDSAENVKEAWLRIEASISKLGRRVNVARSTLHPHTIGAIIGIAGLGWSFCHAPEGPAAIVLRDMPQSVRSAISTIALWMVSKKLTAAMDRAKGQPSTKVMEFLNKACLLLACAHPFAEVQRALDTLQATIGTKEGSSPHPMKVDLSFVGLLQLVSLRPICAAAFGYSRLNALTAFASAKESISLPPHFVAPCQVPQTIQDVVKIGKEFYDCSKRPIFHEATIYGVIFGATTIAISREKLSPKNREMLHEFLEYCRAQHSSDANAKRRHDRLKTLLSGNAGVGKSSCPEEDSHVSYPSDAFDGVQLQCFSSVTKKNAKEICEAMFPCLVGMGMDFPHWQDRHWSCDANETYWKFLRSEMTCLHQSYKSKNPLPDNIFFDITVDETLGSESELKDSRISTIEKEEVHIIEPTDKKKPLNLPSLSTVTTAADSRAKNATDDEVPLAPLSRIDLAVDALAEAIAPFTSTSRTKAPHRGKKEGLLIQEQAANVLFDEPDRCQSDMKKGEKERIHDGGLQVADIAWWLDPPVAAICDDSATTATTISSSAGVSEKSSLILNRLSREMVVKKKTRQRMKMLKKGAISSSSSGGPSSSSSSSLAWVRPGKRISRKTGVPCAIDCKKGDDFPGIQFLRLTGSTGETQRITREIIHESNKPLVQPPLRTAHLKPQQTPTGFRQAFTAVPYQLQLHPGPKPFIPKLVRFDQNQPEINLSFPVVAPTLPYQKQQNLQTALIPPLLGQAARITGACLTPLATAASQSVPATSDAAAGSSVIFVDQALSPLRPPRPSSGSCFGSQLTSDTPAQQQQQPSQRSLGQEATRHYSEEPPLPDSLLLIPNANGFPSSVTTHPQTRSFNTPFSISDERAFHRHVEQLLTSAVLHKSYVPNMLDDAVTNSVRPLGNPPSALPAPPPPAVDFNAVFSRQLAAHEGLLQELVEAHQNCIRELAVQTLKNGHFPLPPDAMTSSQILSRPPGQPIPPGPTGLSALEQAKLLRESMDHRGALLQMNNELMQAQVRESKLAVEAATAKIQSQAQAELYRSQLAQAEHQRILFERQRQTTEGCCQTSFVGSPLNSPNKKSSLVTVGTEQSFSTHIPPPYPIVVSQSIPVIEPIPAASNFHFAPASLLPTLGETKARQALADLALMDSKIAMSLYLADQMEAALQHSHHALAATVDAGQTFRVGAESAAALAMLRTKASLVEAQMKDNLRGGYFVPTPQAQHSSTRSVHPSPARTSPPKDRTGLSPSKQPVHDASQSTLFASAPTIRSPPPSYPSSPLRSAPGPASQAIPMEPPTMTYVSSSHPIGSVEIVPPHQVVTSHDSKVPQRPLMVVSSLVQPRPSTAVKRSSAKREGTRIAHLDSTLQVYQTPPKKKLNKIKKTTPPPSRPGTASSIAGAEAGAVISRKNEKTAQLRSKMAEEHIAKRFFALQQGIAEAQGLATRPTESEAHVREASSKPEKLLTHERLHRFEGKISAAIRK